jgi:hypothetical protein
MAMANIMAATTNTTKTNIRMRLTSASPPFACLCLSGMLKGYGKAKLGSHLPSPKRAGLVGPAALLHRGQLAKAAVTQALDHFGVTFDRAIVVDAC